jgi:CBS domain-containing protein
MKCSKVMTKDPACVTTEDTVKDAAELMKDKDVGPIPVIENEEDRRLIGIITDRDVAVKVVAEGLDPMTTRVSEVMTRDPIVAHPDEELDEALDRMMRRQVRRIPVVDDENCVVGIIAQADVATGSGDADKTAELVKEISEP